MTIRHDIAFASARKLAAMIRGKKIGCVELLDHYLARVEKYNPALNAIIATDIPTARMQARAADRAIKRGDALGAFHGIPMTVKEAFDVKGMPTTWGVPELKDSVASTDSLATERWRAAGAVIFGKTNVPLRLSDGQSFNAIYGTTSNPWNLACTAGGSSGGAAAALAAGMSGIEIGSDIASSIRSPANYCGIYGHKPTFGIVPMRGHAIHGRVSPDDISVAGPMARSASDLDLALSVLAGPDAIDAQGYRLALPPPRAKTLREFRVAVMASHPTSEVDIEVQDAIHRLTEFLGKSKVKVSIVARPDVDMHRVHQLANMMVRVALSYHQNDEEFAQSVQGAAALSADDDSFRARALRGVSMTHRQWLLFNEERHRMRWAWQHFFQDYDVFLAPLVPTAAFPHDHTPVIQRKILVNGKQRPWTDMLFWAGVAGLPYLPATAIPIGLSKDGLPIGIQVIAPHYGDLSSIHFAKLLEKDYYGFISPPGYA